jgi:hypothetical protein
MASSFIFVSFSKQLGYIRNQFPEQLTNLFFANSSLSLQQHPGSVEVILLFMSYKNLQANILYVNSWSHRPLHPISMDGWEM